MHQPALRAEVFELSAVDLLSGLRDVIRSSGLVIKPKEVDQFATSHFESVIKETERKLSEAEIAAHAARLYSKIASRALRHGLSALAEYQAKRHSMAFDELMDEEHNPKRLSRFMKVTGPARPANVSAHAIVSGKHDAAKGARFILGKWRVRIDDPDNGVFLPRDSRYMPHPDMPKAVNHAALHTEKYYLNITPMLQPTSSEEECRLILRLIAKMLVDGTFGH